MLISFFLLQNGPLIKQYSSNVSPTFVSGLKSKRILLPGMHDKGAACLSGVLEIFSDILQDRMKDSVFQLTVLLLNKHTGKAMFWFTWIYLQWTSMLLCHWLWCLLVRMIYNFLITHLIALKLYTEALATNTAFYNLLIVTSEPSYFTSKIWTMGFRAFE